LLKDAVETSNFITSFNITSPKFYTQTIPAIFSIGKAIASSQITWDDIKDTFSESVRAQLYTPFKEIKDNYNNVFSGKASYAEAQEFGRNVATALEAVSVVLGVGAGAKAAQLASKLSTAARSVFKLIAGSEAVGEGLEWVTRVTKETATKAMASLERRFGSEIGTFDLKEWQDMRVSGQVRLSPDGLRIMSIRDIKIFKREMNEKNIKVIVDKNGSILPKQAAGGFNPNTGEIVLRPNASYLSAAHESFHAKQYLAVGKDKYLKLSTLEKEEYVYKEIMKNKELFNSEEIYEAQRYIFKLRNGEWPPPNWKGFEE
jgi:hypothetical protein